MLPGVIQSMPDRMAGFDTDTILTPSLARAFFTEGYRFCLRYIGRDALADQRDLSHQEALDILGAGLYLMPVQHVRSPGWYPKPALGFTDGVFAVYHSLVVGFPLGVNIWCDLEGVYTGISEKDVIGYCNAWYDAVLAAGYTPGLYVGANSILTETELRQLKFSHYWKSLSRVPNPIGRGYQMVQANEHTSHGIQIDDDFVQPDLLHDAVVFLTPLPPVPHLALVT